MKLKILKSAVWVFMAYLLTLYLWRVIEDYTLRVAMSVATGVFLARNEPTLWNFIKLIVLLTGFFLGCLFLPNVFP